MLRERFGRRLGYGRTEHLHGLVEEQAGRLAVFAQAHLATDRHGRFRRDAGLVERHLVTPAGKAVQAVHEDRVIGDFLCQQCLVRVAICPGAFVPAAADDPLAFRHGLRAFDDQCDRFFLGLDADEVDLVQQRPESEDMRMRIDEAREHGGAGEIDDPGRISLELHCVGAAAHEQDLAVPDCDGLRIRVPAGRILRRPGAGVAVRARFFPVERVNAGIDQNKAGVSRRGNLDGDRVLRAAGCQPQDCQRLEKPHRFISSHASVVSEWSLIRLAPAHDLFTSLQCVQAFDSVAFDRRVSLRFIIDREYRRTCVATIPGS